MGIMAKSVRRRSIHIIRLSARIDTVNVFTRYMMAGPATCLTANGRFPLFMLITMRGEWEEFNPWQVPMARATRPTLEAMGVRVTRADEEEAVADAVAAGLKEAYDREAAVALLLGQRLIGRKVW